MSFSVDRRAITKAVLLIAAMSLAAQESLAADLSIKGTATYRERIALPDNAALTVRLLDVTNTSGAPTSVGETVVSPAGQVPIAFEFTVAETVVASDHRYALHASIAVDGKVIFATAEPRPYELSASEPADLLMVRQPDETSTLPAEIVGVEWMLEEMDGKAMDRELVSSLMLNEKGTAGGKGGCNRFFATITASGDALTFSEIGSTFMACGNAAMERERAYFDALARVASYRLDAGKLILSDEAGKNLLIFGLSA